MEYFRDHNCLLGFSAKFSQYDLTNWENVFMTTKQPITVTQRDTKITTGDLSVLKTSYFDCSSVQSEFTLRCMQKCCVLHLN